MQQKTVIWVCQSSGSNFQLFFRKIKLTWIINEGTIDIHNYS